MLANLANDLLIIIIGLPLVGAIILLYVPNLLLVRQISLLVSSITFVVSLLIWSLFDTSSSRYQFVQTFECLPAYNIYFTIGIDGISLFLILLTTFLFPICLLSCWDNVKKLPREHAIAFLVMQSMLIIVFSILDLILFYVFFESVLIPMFLLIGVWGSRERKIRASYLFFLYTLFGSVFMLLGIFYIYNETGTTDYQLLLTSNFTANIQQVLWTAFFLSFATKVPLFGLHLWLPEAHVEATAAGSAILAGILLKLGTYGFVRYSLPLFPIASVYFMPVVYTLCTIGIIFTSLTAIRQTDLKRIIAYASVAHMNLVVIGLFALNLQGIMGSIFQMLSHGVVSSALFLLVGMVYDRHHTRIIKYYSGLVHTMPVFVTSLLFFTLANIALPGTSAFVGEFLILFGVFQSNTSVTFFSATGMVLGGAYSLWLFNRIAFGNIKTTFLAEYIDINRREFYVILPLIFVTLIMGIYPDIFLDPMQLSVQNLLEQIRLS